jgi:uncharacterized surface protein with fasciclin (FAS1) repeats
MYCIDPKYLEANIEGDFDADNFATLTMAIRKCTGPLCQSKEITEKYLNSSNIAIYFVDKVIDPSNHTSPFKPLGRDLFWPISM